MVKGVVGMRTPIDRLAILLMIVSGLILWPVFSVAWMHWAAGLFTPL